MFAISDYWLFSYNFGGRQYYKQFPVQFFYFASQLLYVYHVSGFLVHMNQRAALPSELS